MHPLEPQYRILLTLVRQALGHKADPFKGPADWAAVFGLAVYHKLVAVASDGLDELVRQGGISPDECPSEEIRQKVVSLVTGCEMANEKRRAALRDMAAFYRSHGIRMMVLKGYSLSLDWPVPNHRTAGDIDIWLFGRQKEADELMQREKGIAVDDSHHHHTVFYWDKIMVENHYDFINVHHHRSHVAMEALFKELGQDDSHCVEIDGEKVYVASPPLAALFLLRHTMMHFVSYDFSFRQILDWGLFVKRHGKELDWGWLLDRLEEFGMSPLFHSFNAILTDDFGFDAALFPPVQADAAQTARVRQEIFYPQFRGGEPKLPFFKRIRYKLRRWKAGVWKQKLCYKESVWSGFWSGVVAHILKPASI